MSRFSDFPRGFAKGQESALRPEIVTDEHLYYLDRLRSSGATNMFGAGAYLERKFGMSSGDASTILGYWMKTFPERHPR